MAKPNSRQSFIDYCLRQLGDGVVEVNISDEQIDDIVDDALQFYHNFHDEGTEKYYLKYSVTQENIDNGYITLPDYIHTVTNLLPINTITSTERVFNVRRNLIQTSLEDLTYSGDLTNYVLARQNIELVDDLFRANPRYVFNQHKNQLRIDMDWSLNTKVGTILVIECYRLVDPAQYATVYNDQFLKRYAVALMTKQWGMNLMKFDGVQLVGGVTMNGSDYYEKGKEDLERLEEEVRLAWQKPIGMVIA